MRSLHSHSFCWAFCLSFASVITWFLPPLSEQASARSPIPITFVASSGDDRSDESIQVVYNYNQTSEAIRFLEPAKRMANALGVSDKLSDLSFDLGLFFADEYSDPFFALESGTTHLAEIWGVQVVIDVFNVTDFQPYFEWVRRTTEDPDVLSFYQQIEDSPASFYQFDCWVRTFDGQEFLLSAISLVSDQRNVPLSLASNNRFSNTKQQTCKLSWLTTVLMPEELTPPAPEFPLPGAPDTPHAFAQAISQPEIFDIIIQAPDDSGCTAYCTHCPPGSVNLAFCPGCLPVEYAESLQRQKTIYFNAMQQQREDFENCLMAYLEGTATILCKCFNICGFTTPGLFPGPTPVSYATIIACLASMGITVTWGIADCWSTWWDDTSMWWEHYVRGYTRIVGLYCEGTTPF